MKNNIPMFHHFALAAACHPERSEGPHTNSVPHPNLPCVINQDGRGPSPSARLGMTEARGAIFAMRKFYTLLSREVSSYFYSPIAYIVLVFFLFVSGADFYFQISFMNQRPVQYSVQEAFFNSVFFWFAFVLIFPLITMRLFAEEFKLGTIEPLMTAPVRDWQVVLAKFFGALVFYLVLWVPTILYFLIFQYITGQTAAGSTGAYWGSYLMLLLLGMFYISIGCFASVLTRNQIIAAVISFCAITMHFFSGLITFILTEVSSDITGIRDPQMLRNAIEHLAANGHRQVLVQPQLEGVEVLVGLTHHDALGSFVVVALGGIWQSCSTTSSSHRWFRPGESQAMIRRLRGYGVLAGARGTEPVDEDALTRLIERIDILGRAMGNAIASLDVNPVIVNRDGASGSGRSRGAGSGCGRARLCTTRCLVPRP